MSRHAPVCSPASPSALRLAIRHGRQDGPTGALAPGFAQANLAVVPQVIAEQFEAFLLANPAVFPLLARGRAGDPSLPALGQNIDIRHDIPRYRIFRDGVAQRLTHDIGDVWRDDLVSFAVGCSLGFEHELVERGIALRCYGPGVTCAAFDSAIACVAAGALNCNLVVSMRAIRAGQVERAVELTRQMPQTHGAPVHVGDPAAIGVDLALPIDGIGLTDIRPGEVPVFWACGVTLERAIEAARPDLAITHAPGHMLITDMRVKSCNRPIPGDDSKGGEPWT